VLVRAVHQGKFDHELVGHISRAQREAIVALVGDLRSQLQELDDRNFQLAAVAALIDGLSQGSDEVWPVKSTEGAKRSNEPGKTRKRKEMTSE
jgi:hypothetical protein